MKLIQLANSVGYDSDAVPNEAFKLVLGVTPGEYRRGDSHRKGTTCARRRLRRNRQIVK